MEASSKASTGVKGLDLLLDGGFTRGSIVLIAGHAGAGKTTLQLSFYMRVLN